MDPEPIVPTPAAAEPAAFEVSTLFGGDPTPTPAPAAPDPTPAPAAAPATPATMLEQILANPAPAAPVTPATETKPAAEISPGWEKWMKDHYPEAPEGIAKVDNWKASREINVKLIQSLAEKEAELEAVRGQGSGVRGQRAEGRGQWLCNI